MDTVDAEIVEKFDYSAEEEEALLAQLKKLRQSKPGHVDNFDIENADSGDFNIIKSLRGAGAEELIVAPNGVSMTAFLARARKDEGLMEKIKQATNFSDETLDKLVWGLGGAGLSFFFSEWLFSRNPPNQSAPKRKYNKKK